MSLADEARNLKVQRGPRCETCRILETPLGPELQEALDDPEIYARSIHLALKLKRGVHLGEQSITRHRRGLCYGAE